MPGPFTRLERLLMHFAADDARATDADLSDLMHRLADGDDSTMPAIYERLLACGKIAQADRLRAIVERHYAPQS